MRPCWLKVKERKKERKKELLKSSVNHTTDVKCCKSFCDQKACEVCYFCSNSSTKWNCKNYKRLHIILDRRKYFNIKAAIQRVINVTVNTFVNHAHVITLVHVHNANTRPWTQQPIIKAAEQHSSVLQTVIYFKERSFHTNNTRLDIR